MYLMLGILSVFDHRDCVWNGFCIRGIYATLSKTISAGRNVLLVICPKHYLRDFSMWNSTSLSIENFTQGNVSEYIKSTWLVQKAGYEVEKHHYYGCSYDVHVNTYAESTAFLRFWWSSAPVMINIKKNYNNYWRMSRFSTVPAMLKNFQLALT